MDITLLVNWISEVIAYAGVVVVIVGVVVTLVKLVHYLLTGFSTERAIQLRHVFMIYLSLGLDFIIAKDIIVTLSLDGRDLPTVLQLVLVIGVRFLLSFFVHFEEKSSKKSVK